MRQMALKLPASDRSALHEIAEGVAPAVAGKGRAARCHVCRPSEYRARTPGVEKV